ncbi:hypothetical protein D3C80_1322180 [compost metagenome]
MNRPEFLARTAGDPRILAFWIDTDHRTVGGQQVWNDRAHTLAGTRRRHRQQMGRAIIAQGFARFRMTTDQQAGSG